MAKPHRRMPQQAKHSSRVKEVPHPGRIRLPSAFQPLYETSWGQAVVADSLDVMRALPAESIDLVMTSPPFALKRKKEYGNKDS